MNFKCNIPCNFTVPSKYFCGGQYGSGSACIGFWCDIELVGDPGGRGEGGDHYFSVISVSAHVIRTKNLIRDFIRKFSYSQPPQEIFIYSGLRYWRLPQVSIAISSVS